MKFQKLYKQVMRLVEEQKIEPQEALSLLDEIPSNGNDSNDQAPVAVVGISIKLPQTRNIDDLWRHLMNKSDLVGTFPKERFDLITKARAELNKRYQTVEKKLESDSRSYAAWLNGIEQFDPEAFGLTDHEAQFMGPAERLFLQTALEGLVRAGYRQDDLKGSRTGVYVAHTPYPAFDYLRLFDDPDERAYISNIPANMGYHLAYTLDLRGPVMTVNTSCSSSLAAVHIAKHALRQGDCDTAVVGGINLNLFPYWDEDAPDHVVRSPHYRCASFDAQADGIIGGEGIAVVVLKRLSVALRDRNHIHAVLKGSAMSSDGASNGMQVPNPDAQSQAIMDALRDAGVSFDSVQFVEAHGAGTPIGDLVEVEGLSKAYHHSSQQVKACRLGSIKSNVGHMGDAAGIAGLIKAVLSLEKRLVPGLQHFQQANEQIPFAETPFVVTGEHTPLTGDAPLRAGVNSIGISGTNVHAVLEEYPRNPVETKEEKPLPLFLSGRSRRALWDQVQSLATHLKENPQYALQDITYTLNVRRSHEQARISIFASSTQEFSEKVDRLLSVRTFERAPDSFFEQGIFLADEADTQAESMRNLKRYPFESETDRVLMEQFLRGEDVRSTCEERFVDGVMLPLPVEWFNTKRIWPASQETFEQDLDDLFYAAKWEPLPNDEKNRDALHMRNGALWLLFAHHGDPRMGALKKRLVERGAEVIEVLPGDRFYKHSRQCFEIDLHDQHAYEKLFQEMGAETYNRLAGVIHAFTLRKVDQTMQSLEDLEYSQQEGVFSLYSLMKTVIDLDITHPFQLNVLSSYAEQVDEQEEIIPARVTLFGLAKVVSQEQPTIASFAIDHDLCGSAEEVAKQICDEFAQPVDSRPELVTYRKQTRYRKVIERQADTTEKELSVREGGTYVIAGGTGYLGVQIGKFLSQRANVNLVLLARNALPSRDDWAEIVNGANEEEHPQVYQLKEIMEIERRGSQVSMLTCDVTDEEDVKATFSKIKQMYGPIHGAFMLVKQLYHLWIKELELEQFQTGIFNRVKGTWLVEKEIASPDLDFFILFSSISSLMGTKSASECCAVNQYLDAMAGFLNHRGVPGHVLNLTLILDDKRDFGSRTAIPPIDFVDFHNALNRFFNNGHRWSLVSRFDLDEVHYLKPVIKIPFADSFWEEVEQAVQSESQPSPETVQETENLDIKDLETRIQSIWKTVLGMETVKPEDNFFSAGGTSLSALRFVQLMKKNFVKLRFEVSDLYSNPTFAAQVKVCKDEYFPQDEWNDIFDALENDEISSEEALTLLDKAGKEF
ncbi:beta-ketoacyl synthase N-terminal-like domain-containing protein [Melghirimyces algeriensis]|uniref:Polyketide synthase PksL n=1 Tax=Melghirimyces algeriensis TaxID=910412 RepID=A0A521ABA3_9BACL|nr:beta-ketoacyl synthase N-terminal-like domain-containing protein [Melghirimyces algeriensis]SMO32062.1 polyketide synthase PksL [Melghirimyces algeriensis]